MQVFIQPRHPTQEETHIPFYITRSGNREGNDYNISFNYDNNYVLVSPTKTAHLDIGLLLPSGRVEANDVKTGKFHAQHLCRIDLTIEHTETQFTVTCFASMDVKKTLKSFKKSYPMYTPVNYRLKDTNGNAVYDLILSVSSPNDSCDVSTKSLTSETMRIIELNME